MKTDHKKNRKEILDYLKTKLFKGKLGDAPHYCSPFAGYRSEAQALSDGYSKKNKKEWEQALKEQTYGLSLWLSDSEDKLPYRMELYYAGSGEMIFVGHFKDTNDIQKIFEYTGVIPESEL